MIEEDIFKKSSPDYDKLLEYGFYYDESKYYYRKKILSDSFEIQIVVEDDRVSGTIYDIEMNDEYLGFRIEDHIGEFAGIIRNEFMSLLIDIREKCFLMNSFVSHQANRISHMIQEKYGDYPCFEWDNYPDFGVFKNKESKKWYALIMNISCSKLGDNSDEMVDVLNVKVDSNKIQQLLKQNGYYRAYHMNKKNWISLILNDTLTDDVILSFIDESYSYSVNYKNQGEWIIPANPRYYNIEDAFQRSRIIMWKQSSDIQVDDIVYIYVGAPVSALLYKCKVLRNYLPYHYSDSNVHMKYVMEIELLEKYNRDLFPFSILKEYGVKAVRGPRYITKELVHYINEKTR